MASQMLSPGQIPDAPPDYDMPEKWQENLNVHMVCPECREFPPNLVENFAEGDTVCGSCGIVLDNRMVDTRSEWRTFANDESSTDDPSRVGSAANPLFEGSQLETHIAFGDGGARARDLHRAHSKLETDSNNKNLKEAYGKISAFCSLLSLPDNVVQYAQETYKDVHAQKSFKGKNMNNTLAGCLFIASRRTNHVRTFKAITNATGVSKKDTGRAFKLIQDFVRDKKSADRRRGKHLPTSLAGLNLADNDTDAAGNNIEAGPFSTAPSALVEELCQKLRLSRLVIKVSYEVAEKLMSTAIIAGRSPLSVAAVSVYFASHLMGEPKSPKDIAALGQVSDGTIRTSYKLVVLQLDKIIEERWLRAGGKRELLPNL